MPRSKRASPFYGFAHTLGTPLSNTHFKRNPSFLDLRSFKGAQEVRSTPHQRIGECPLDTESLAYLSTIGEQDLSHKCPRIASDNPYGIKASQRDAIWVEKELKMGGVP